MSEQSLLKKIFIYSIGNISITIANFFLVPFYTFYLTPKEYGIYDLIISTTTILVPLLTLHIELGILRWMLPSNNDKKKIISNAIVILILNILIFSIIFFLLNKYSKIKYTDWIYLFVITFSFYGIIRQYIRGIGRNTQYVLADILYILIYFVFILFFMLHLKLGVKGLLISSIFAYFITILYLTIQSHFWLQFNFKLISISFIKELLKYTIPLIPNTINLLLMSILLKYIIVWFVGIEYNGIFAVAYKFASLLYIFNSIFYLAWQEKSIQTYDKKKSKSYFSSVLNYYNKFLIIILIILVSLQRFILPIFISPEFENVIKYVPLLLLGNFYMVIGNFYGIIYQCEKKTAKLSFSSILGTFVTVTIAISLSFLIKMYAIIIAYSIGNFILMIYRIKDTKKYIQLDYNENDIIFISIFIILMSIFQIYFKIIFSIITSILCLIFYLNINKQIIINSSSIVKNSLYKLKK